MHSFTFDGTRYIISPNAMGTGWTVCVYENGASTAIETDWAGSDLAVKGAERGRYMVESGMDRWTADRFGYVFSLAARKIAQRPWLR